MEIWQDGVLAGLAAVGLTALIWLLAGALFRWQERPLDAVYVVALTGGAEKLDMTLRELARERLRGRTLFKKVDACQHNICPNLSAPAPGKTAPPGQGNGDSVDCRQN